MDKLKIKIITIGHLPIEFNKKRIEKYSSEIFEISGEIENYSLNSDSDGINWEFSDELIQEEIPKTFDADFLIALVNVPVEQNYYTRRLRDNKIVFTFYEVKDILEFNNIPLENIIYRLLYGYSLIHKRYKSEIPDLEQVTNFTHDETRGCLFDMNGIKSDIVHSCVRPILCSECVERLKKEKVSENTINLIQEEIKKINKESFYRITDFIKQHPILVLIISSFAAILFGIIGSVLGNYIFDWIK